MDLHSLTFAALPLGASTFLQLKGHDITWLMAACVLVLQMGRGRRHCV